MTQEDHSSNATTTDAAGGIGGDLRQLRMQSAATAAELREFIARTRGRSAADVLGMVAESHLVRCIAKAAVAAALLLIVGTVVPWLLRSSDDRSATVKAPATSGTAAPGAPSSAAEASPAGGPATAVAVKSNGPTPDAQRAVKAMGLDEAKTADPNVNPLENKLDNLLDGVK